MAQQVKVYIIKHDNPSLIPETQLVAGENRLSQIVHWLEGAYFGLCMLTHPPIPSQSK